MKAMGAAQKLFGFVSLVSVSFFSYLFLVRIKKKIQPKEKEIEKEVYDGERKRENECSTPPNIDLPCELIENILLCLPVKDLLRCKCVSKSWFILICSTSFVNKHLEYCARSRTRVGLIVKENANDNWIRTVHLDDMPGNNQCDTDRVESCDPVHDTGNECKIVGSCNGLVCFTSKFNHLTIWNPSTRKAHNLSCRPRGFEDFLSITETRFICGFGHDRISDDYKVIELEGNFVDITTRFCTQIWVYSLKTKSWTISSSPYFLSKQQISFVPGYGIFTGNALHWIMERRDFNLNDYRRYLIGALDIGADNQFYEVQKPDYCDSNNVVLINLGVLDRCLCVCSGRPTDSIDIWVMKEYSVKESWTRLISFSTISPSFYGRKMPLAYSRCGHKLMLHDCSNRNPELIWYDLKTKIVRSVPLFDSDLKDVFFAQAYMYSLVNPCN